MIRALDAITDDLSVTQRTAAMGTDIGHATRAPVLVAPQDELQAEHFHPQRRVGDVRALFGRIPEIYKHVVIS